MNKLAKEILDAVYITVTTKKVKGIISIIESNHTNKPTLICDYLKIERRFNRTEIRRIFIKNNLNF